MTDELKAYLDGMEKRLLAALNDNQEHVLNRLTSIGADLRNLRTEHAGTREMVTRLPATVLAIFEQPLLDRLTAIEKRVSKLDGEP